MDKDYIGKQVEIIAPTSAFNGLIGRLVDIRVTGWQVDYMVDLGTDNPMAFGRDELLFG